MEKSHCYNPFVYIKTDNDVQKLSTNLFKSTTPKGSTTNDPFWDTAASMLLLALIFYLKYEAPEEEQNFVMVMELLRAGDVKEDDDDYVSPLDMLFNRLETKNPEHIALKYYRAYHSGSAKTLKSIQVTLASRLEKFNLESMAQLTQTDELDLPSLGEKKVALFAIIPDNDTSFNFLVSILYTQLFQQLFYLADYKYSGSLPVHVHFVMDEFANVSLPDDFDKILSVMRSREVSVSIILQNLAQLKALFEKQWESIVGNCDEFLYLGGNEQSTHKYVSELLGKETIDTNTYGRSYGSHGNYSKNDQIAGRELLTPDEVRMLDNNYALLFIRGERPVKDYKFNLKEHFNSIYTPIGNKLVKPYLHGGIENSIGTISFNLDDIQVDTKDIINLETKEADIELLSNEEIDNMYKEDIEEYVNKVEDKVVKIIELKNYPREIPDELVDVIKDTEHIFDDFYILFTDYTGEVEKQVEEVRKEKDPILFGIFKNGNNLYNRFYYLGDWIDEYCDLTLEKIIEEEGERIAKTISTPITTDELLLELERIKEERSNTKNDNIHYTYTISNNVVTSKNIDSYNDSEYNSDRIEEVTDRKFFSKVKTFLTKRGKK